MEIKEIKQSLSTMGFGAETVFLKYCISKGVFKNIDIARTVFTSYAVSKSHRKCSSFVRRQQISKLFFEFMQYVSEDGQIDKKKLAIVKFNERLKGEWDGKA